MLGNFRCCYVVVILQRKTVALHTCLRKIYINLKRELRGYPSENLLFVANILRKANGMTYIQKFVRTLIRWVLKM